MSDNTKKIILTVSIVALIITVGITIYLIILKNKQTSSDTQPLDLWSSTQKSDLDTFLKDKVNNISIPPLGGMTGMTGMTGINIPLSLSQTQINNISNNIIKNYKYDEYTTVKRPLFSLSPPVPNNSQIKFQIFLFDQLKEQSIGSNNIYSKYFDWNYWLYLLKDEFTNSNDNCYAASIIKKYPNPITFMYLITIFFIYYKSNPLNNNLPLQLPSTGDITDLMNSLIYIVNYCNQPIPPSSILFGLF